MEEKSHPFGSHIQQGNIRMRAFMNVALINHSRFIITQKSDLEILSIDINIKKITSLCIMR